MREQHGGDTAAYRIEYGSEPLDFSANLSPLGLPRGVRQAASAALDEAAAYPDPECRALRSAISKAFRLPAESILCGNGAADLIWRLIAALRPKHALITAPTFGEYRAALHRAGCETEELLLREADGFRLQKSVLDRISPETDLVILCEPNNPTGVTTEPALLRQILARCRACGCLLAVDECFRDFLAQPDEGSLLREAENGGVLVLRAFTKFYAMAGLRLGWCFCAEAELLRRMQEQGQPWPVSSIAQAAGRAALQETEYAERLRALIPAQREALRASLASFGCRVIPGEANYLLFFSPVPELGRRLAARGILIRSCADYSGLGPGWYRIAVRTEEENRRLIETIREVL